MGPLIVLMFVIAWVVVMVVAMPSRNRGVIEPRQEVQGLPQGHNGPVEHRESDGSNFATKHAH